MCVNLRIFLNTCLYGKYIYVRNHSESSDYMKFADEVSSTQQGMVFSYTTFFIFLLNDFHITQLIEK